MAYRNILDITKEKTSRSHYLDLSMSAFILEKLLELGIYREPSNEMAKFYFESIGLNIQPSNLNRAKALYRTEIIKYYQGNFISIIRSIIKQMFNKKGTDENKENFNVDIKIKVELLQRVANLYHKITRLNTNHSLITSDIDGIFGSSKTLYYVRQQSTNSITSQWDYLQYVRQKEFTSIPPEMSSAIEMWLSQSFYKYDYTCGFINGSTIQQDKESINNVIKLLLSFIYNKLHYNSLYENPEYDMKSWSNGPDNHIVQKILIDMGQHYRNLGGVINNICVDDPGAIIVLSPFMNLNHYTNSNTKKFTKSIRSVNDDSNKMLFLCIWQLVSSVQEDGNDSCRVDSVSPC